MKRDAVERLSDLVSPQRGMHSVTAECFHDMQPGTQESCWVVQEQALRLEVAQVGDYTLMCTPTGSTEASGFTPDEGVLGDASTPGALALAAGFLLTEGFIRTLADVASMAICPQSLALVQVHLVAAQQVRTDRRSGVVASSCGVCGNLDHLPDSWVASSPVRDTFTVTPAQLHRHMLTMRQHQLIFGHTGGTHAAAIFDARGALLATAEDLGRHNALDKAIGHCLLHGRPTAASCAVLSGRISLEMILKAARAGIEVMAAVSAPSSLAIEVARRSNITLCGFVRGHRLTAFTHPQRLSTVNTAGRRSTQLTPLKI